MWFILLTSLLTQGLATQVSFQTSSSSSASASSSSEQKNEWSWQEPTAGENSPQESYHPLNFLPGDAQPDQFNDNIHDGSSGVAYSTVKKLFI